MRKILRVEKSLATFGNNLKIARLRRNLPQAMVAERAGISVLTLQKLESGASGVSLGNCAAVLFALGFDTPFSDIASPLNDALGQRLAEMELPQRARVKKSE